MDSKKRDNKKKSNNEFQYSKVKNNYTSFQKRVWQACSKIPKGKISTYKLIAESIGTKAYRAVGHALNKNPYSPKVPCHRVVNSDRSIGGFASGVKAKIKLLRKEGITVSDSNTSSNTSHSDSNTVVSGSKIKKIRVLCFKKKLFKPIID